MYHIVIITIIFMFTADCATADQYVAASIGGNIFFRVNPSDKLSDCPASLTDLRFTWKTAVPLFNQLYCSRQSIRAVTELGHSIKLHCKKATE